MVVQEGHQAHESDQNQQDVNSITLYCDGPLRRFHFSFLLSTVLVHRVCRTHGFPKQQPTVSGKRVHYETMRCLPAKPDRESKEKRQNFGFEALAQGG